MKITKAPKLNPRLLQLITLSSTFLIFILLSSLALGKDQPLKEVKILFTQSDLQIEFNIISNNFKIEDLESRSTSPNKLFSIHKRKKTFLNFFQKNEIIDIYLGDWPSQNHNLNQKTSTQPFFISVESLNKEILDVNTAKSFLMNKSTIIQDADIKIFTNKLNFKIVHAQKNIIGSPSINSLLVLGNSAFYFSDASWVDLESIKITRIKTQ